MQKTLAPYANVDIDIPVGESIAIVSLGGGIAKIFYRTAPTVQPPKFYFSSTIRNEATTLGTFAYDHVIRIENGGSEIQYNVDVSPTIGTGGDAVSLSGLTSSQFLRSDASDTIVTNANLQIGEGEGNVRIQHSSANNALFMTPYDGGGYDGSKQLHFDADTGQWTIEGDPQIGNGVSGSFANTDTFTITVTNGVITTLTVS